MTQSRRLSRIEESLPVTVLPRRSWGERGANVGRNPAFSRGDGAKAPQLAIDLTLQSIFDAIPSVAAMLPGPNKAKAIAALVDAADTAIRLDRDVHGIRAGEPSAPVGVDRASETRIIRTTTTARYDQ